MRSSRFDLSEGFARRPLRVAVVLSGGGARGLAHIGVLEEVERLGFKVVSVTGTSMGAIVGGVYASGRLSAFKEWIFSLDRMELLKLVHLSFHPEGLINVDRAFRRMQRVVPDMRIESLPVKFSATATDLSRAKEVVFRRGRLYDAFRASVAIPTVISAVKLPSGRLLVDGGVMHNLPLHVVSKEDVDVVIAVDVNASIPFRKPRSVVLEERLRKRSYRERLRAFRQFLRSQDTSHQQRSWNYVQILNKTMGILTHQIVDRDLSLYPPDVLIALSRDSCGLFDFFKAREQVAYGHSVARRALLRFLREQEK